MIQRIENKVLIVSSLGTALEWYDFYLYNATPAASLFISSMSWCKKSYIFDYHCSDGAINCNNRDHS